VRGLVGGRYLYAWLIKPEPCSARASAVSFQRSRNATDRGCGQALLWLNRIMLPDGSRNAQSLTPYA
jgi:hypothetical protein